MKIYFAMYLPLAAIIAVVVYKKIRRATPEDLDAVLYRMRMFIYTFVGIAIVHLFIVIGLEGLPAP